MKIILQNLYHSFLKKCINIKNKCINWEEKIIHTTFGCCIIFIETGIIFFFIFFSFVLYLADRYTYVQELVDIHLPQETLYASPTLAQKNDIMNDIVPFSSGKHTGVDYFSSVLLENSGMRKRGNLEKIHQIPEENLDFQSAPEKDVSGFIQEEIKNIPKIEKKDTHSEIYQTQKDITNATGDEFSFIPSDFKNEFAGIIVQEKNSVLENGIWYTYQFQRYQTLGVHTTPSLEQIKKIGIIPSTTLLLIDKNQKINYVTQYEKKKLLSDDIIKDIVNKEVFLKELADDMRYYTSDNDLLFQELKQTTEKLTKGYSQSQKIARIYNYILSHLSYTPNFSGTETGHFSGIESFSSKIASCGGYTKLFLYMLSFAGIENVQVIRGHVIDAPDFPNIGHAWVKIGGWYYDPTFDDPIGLSRTKNKNEYKYYSLPYDLFYSNRFDYGKLPTILKNQSLNERKKYVYTQLQTIAEKYKGSGYILFQELQENTSTNISEENSDIDYIGEGENKTSENTVEEVKEKNTLLPLVSKLTELKSAIPYFEVHNYMYVHDGEKKVILSLDYYPINEDTVEILMTQLQNSPHTYTLLLWDDTSYRLAYNMVTQ